MSAAPASSVALVAARDPHGLRLAALEILERSLRARDLDRILAQADRDDAPGRHARRMDLLESLAPASSLSPGYGLFIAYLMWLEQMIEAGAAFTLKAEEAEGLRSLRAARIEFQRAHPACPACGAPQDHKFARSCRDCGYELRR